MDSLIIIIVFIVVTFFINKERKGNEQNLELRIRRLKKLRKIIILGFLLIVICVSLKIVFKFGIYGLIYGMINALIASRTNTNILIELSLINYIFIFQGIIFIGVITKAINTNEKMLGTPLE